MAGTKIGVVGCGGRMGRMLVAEIAATEGCSVAGGSEAPGSGYVNQDIGELAGIGESLAGAGFEMHASDRLQRVPRGVDPAHPRADLLRYKGLAAMRDFGVQPWLETRRCRDAVADAWRATAPLVGWLGRHVGPAEGPDQP